MREHQAVASEEREQIMKTGHTRIQTHTVNDGWTGARLTAVAGPAKPPVEEPPNRPQKPPVEEPDKPLDKPPKPDLPPAGEPIDVPPPPPIKESPPK